MKSLKNFILDGIQTYVTTRRVSVRNKQIGTVNIISKLFILFIIGGLIWYVITTERFEYVRFLEMPFCLSFQYFIFGQLRRVSVMSNTLTTKVKGLGYLDSTIRNKYNETVFDTADYVIPSDEKDSIFIMTNFILTEQKRDVCDEDPTITGATCTSETECLTKDFTRWNGKPTGLCINSTRNPTLKVCQINAWCPVEDDTNPNNIIQNVLNYTIFVKSTVEFQDFEIKESNILSYMTNDYLSTCTRSNDSLCPIFQVKDILKEAEPNDQNIIKMLAKGGVIEFQIVWDCDFAPPMQPCLPFTSLKDLTVSHNLALIFDKFSFNGTLYRDLYKMFGLRIMMTTTGRGLKPDAIGIIVAFLAFTTLFSFSIVITDCYVNKCFGSQQNKSKFKRAVIKNFDETFEDEDTETNSNKINGDYERI